MQNLTTNGDVASNNCAPPTRDIVENMISTTELDEHRETPSIIKSVNRTSNNARPSVRHVQSMVPDKSIVPASNKATTTEETVNFHIASTRSTKRRLPLNDDTDAVGE